MPGPGVELIGEEEIAEVMQVLTSRSLSRYGSADDPAFGAKVRHVEQEIAALAGVKYALGPERRRLGRAVDLAAGPGHRAGRRGHRARLHVRRLDLRDRLRPGDAGPRRGRRLVQPRSGRRRGEDHAPDPGDHRRPHARRAGAARRDQGRRRPPRHPAHRGLRAGLRRVLPGPGRRRDRRHRASTASTSTRPSPAATAG